MHLMAKSSETEDAKVLLDIPSPMSNVMNVKSAFKLVDICLDNTLEILCKSMFFSFLNIGRLTNQNFQKCGSYNLEC